jgi:hypothetical protein
LSITKILQKLSKIISLLLGINLQPGNEFTNGIRWIPPIPPKSMYPYPLSFTLQNLTAVMTVRPSKIISLKLLKFTGTKCKSSYFAMAFSDSLILSTENPAALATVFASMTINKRFFAISSSPSFDLLP